MKILRKTNLLIMALLLLGFGPRVLAADLMVAENGAGGAYATITAAIAAAVDGDRVIIVPKSGGAAYGETLTIDKSLQFLCANEGQQFKVQGNITINPSNGMEVTFIGMYNLSGSIDGSSSLSAGDRCVVNIMNCNFEAGNVNFNYDNYKLNLVSSVVNGQVALRYGRVLGNQITNNGTAVGVGTDAYPTNDTIWIVGNKIVADYWSGGSYAGINYNNTSQFFYISNNYIKFEGNYNYSGRSSYGIWVSGNKDSSVGRNTILNNTLKRIEYTSHSQNNVYAIAVDNTPANSKVDLANNLILATSSFTIVNGLRGLSNSGVVSSSYAWMNEFITTPFNGISDDGTNYTSSNTTIDTDGRPAGG
ncbi:MAG: hypothetical protein C0594_14535 [Marinilabiliales bacterium]|nr:MAG: hypothetical protein C0594_14535 [Marinilabiliales bacterium]